MSQDIPQTRAELEEHLADQLYFLRSSAESFDSGFDGEAKRLAVTLRILLHTTRRSASLLGQLGMQTGSFLSTAIPHDQGNLSTHGGLIMIAAAGKDTRYVAMLDDVPFTRWLPFENWWNEVVFVDDRRQSLTRRQLILSVADQDGGAHVDPALNETYSRLSRQNSLGWVITAGEISQPIPKPERAAVRQIAHEVLKTLTPGYQKQPNHAPDIFFGGAMIHEGSAPPPLPIPAKIGRNDPCPCGSGRKYKKCHGAPT